MCQTAPAVATLDAPCIKRHNVHGPLLCTQTVHQHRCPQAWGVALLISGAECTKLEMENFHCEPLNQREIGENFVLAR